MVEQRVGKRAHRGRVRPRIVRYAVAGSAVVAAFTLVPGASSASAIGLANGHHARSSAAKSTFSNGNATGIAEAVQLAPRTGGLSAAITLGTTIADYRATLAQASSQAIDLGVVGTTLTVQCDSSAPLLKPSQLPQPLIAESTNGNAHATKSMAGQGSSGFAATSGQESVAVTTLPKSTADYVGDGLIIPGVVSITGMTSGSTAQVIPGQARVATATAHIGQIALANGLILLKDMTWTVEQRTGTHPQKSTSFSMGSATIAGKSLPANEAALNKTFTSINNALALTGLHITPPYRTTTGGVLAIKPLTIGIDNSKLGGTVVNPLLGAIQSEDDTIQATLEKISCKFGSAFSVLDLDEAALDGTGGLDLNLGGATATSAGTHYSNPFGNQTLGGGGGGPQTNPSTGTTKPTSTGSTGQSGAGGGTGGSSLPSTSSTGSGSSGNGTVPTVAGTRSMSESCSTTSPANRPSCSDGQALTVGLIALGALGGIAAADLLVTRRRQKLPRQALTL
jgi:hypothetical protein